MKIIAECAINYNSMEEAKLMIKRSKEVGCWASKFQLFNESNITNPEIRDYCMERMLDLDKAKMLFEYGKEIGQEVFFTPMYDCIDFLEELGVNYYKIRCKDNKNFPLVKKCLNTKKKVFISVDFMPDLRTKQIKYLYCIPKYPALYSDYSHGSLRSFKGISDHTRGLLLLETILQEKYNYLKYFEKHVCLTRENCLEAKWAVTFEELEEVLKK